LHAKECKCLINTMIRSRVAGRVKFQEKRERCMQRVVSIRTSTVQTRIKKVGKRLGGKSRALLPSILFLLATVDTGTSSRDHLLQLFILEKALYFLRRTDHFPPDQEDR